MLLFASYFQVAEKILNKKELEFYKWDGDLSQLLQNVREKLNKVAEVSFLVPFNSCIFILYLFDSLNLQTFSFILLSFFTQSWTREQKDHCLEETEKSFKLSGDILRLILSS